MYQLNDPSIGQNSGGIQISNRTRLNGIVFILMKFSSLAALEVVKMTISSAASDENFFKNDDIFISVHIWHAHLKAYDLVARYWITTKVYSPNN